MAGQIAIDQPSREIQTILAKLISTILGITIRLIYRKFYVWVSQ